MTAYFAIESSYEGPYWDEEVMTNYVFTSQQGRQQRDLVNSQKEEDSVRKNVIAEYNAWVIGSEDPNRIPESQWENVYPLRRAHYLGSTEAILELLNKERNQSLEPASVNWLRKFRELNHFPEQSAVLVPRHFSFQSYLKWVVGMFVVSSLILRGSVFAIKWIGQRFKR